MRFRRGTPARDRTPARRAAFPVALAVAVVASVATAAVPGAPWRALQAGGQHGADARGIQAPSPLPPLERHPVTSPVRVVLRDVDVTTSGGVRIEVPVLVVEARLGDGWAGGGGPLLHVYRATADGPRITSPVGTARASGAVGGGSTLFLDPGPRVTADSIRVRGGEVRRRAASPAGHDPWTYRWRDVDLLLTDLAVGGPEDDGATLRLSLRGNRGGRPLRLSSLRASLVRTADGLTFRGGVRLDRSRLRLDGVVAPDGAAILDVEADTVVFAEVGALVAALPDAGGARGHVRVRRADDETRLDLDGVVVEMGESTAEVGGALVLGGGGHPQAVGLVMRSDAIEAADLETLGVSVPAGRYAAVLRADGGPSEIRVSGAVERSPDPSAEAGSGRDAFSWLRDSPWRVSLEGTVAPRPGRMDLAVAGQAPVGDSAVVAEGRIRGARASGSGTERLVDGTLRVAVRPAAAGGAGGGDEVPGSTNGRGVTTVLPSPGAPTPAIATFRASFDEGRAEAALRLDSVPLALVPTPAGLAGLRGLARADLRLARAPGGGATVGGVIELVGGGARVDATGLELKGGRGRIRLEEGALILEDVAVDAGGGRVTAEGRVAPGELAGLRIEGAPPGVGPGIVDVVVTADSVRVVDDTLAQVDASGRLRIEGSLRAPRLDGRVVPTGWVREDYFKPDPGLDLDDPPFASLAARVPWPAGSRLLQTGGEPDAGVGLAVDPSAGGRADPGRPGSGRAPGAGGPTGRVVVSITRALRMIDEDSEVRGTGDLVLELGDPVHTRGRIAVEQGFFAQYGTLFHVYGGAFVFDGPGLQPRIALRSELEDEAALVGDDEAPPEPERQPPIQFFGYGEVGSALELVTRYSLVPRSQLELVRYVLLGLTPQPVEGWRVPLIWRPDGGGGPVDRRAIAQGVPLAWSYIADQGYDYIPLDLAYMRAGVVTVGSRFPVRMQVAPVMKAAAVLGDRFEIRLSQPLLAEAPGVAGVYRRGGLRLEAFTGPRFFPAPALGAGWPGYTARRRTGIAARWGVQY